MNKIEIVTSVGFSFHMSKGCTVQKALKNMILKKVTTYSPCSASATYGLDIIWNLLNIDI
jgi:hypothetical protein